MRVRALTSFSLTFESEPGDNCPWRGAAGNAGLVLKLPNGNNRSEVVFRPLCFLPTSALWARCSGALVYARDLNFNFDLR